MSCSYIAETEQKILVSSEDESFSEKDIKCKDSDRNESSLNCDSESKSRKTSMNSESSVISVNNSKSLNESLIGLNISDNESIKEFIKISNGFGLKLYRFMSSMFPNFIFSPISISVMLTLLLRASSGNSHNELCSTLSLNSSTLNMTKLQNSVQQTLEYLRNPMKTMNGIELEANNGILLRDGTKIITNFLHDSNSYFGAKVKGINFKLGFKTAQEKITKWIEDNTKSRLITNRINFESIKVDTNIIILSDLYFNVITNFANSLLIEKDFYAFGSHPINTEFYQRAENHNITSSRFFNSTILEMILNTDGSHKRFSMIIILPNSNQSLDSVEELVVDNNDQFLTEISNMTSRFVNVMLPNELTQPGIWRLDRILPYIGIKGIFQPETSLLTKISSFESLYVNRIYHESFFGFKPLNNNVFHGSKNTVSVGNTKQVAVESDFIANRPFIYMIIERKSSAIILMAKINFI